MPTLKCTQYDTTHNGWNVQLFFVAHKGWLLMRWPENMPKIPPVLQMMTFNAERTLTVWSPVTSDLERYYHHVGADVNELNALVMQHCPRPPRMPD